MIELELGTCTFISPWLHKQEHNICWINTLKTVLVPNGTKKNAEQVLIISNNYQSNAD